MTLSERDKKHRRRRFIQCTADFIPDALGDQLIDLAGGAPLEIFEEMSEPGMMLLFDQNGTLTVADEVDDLEFYRAYSYAEERDE